MLERITYLDVKRRKRYRVFVYGTLLSTGPNHAQYLRQKNHEVEDIGMYEVKGELWVWGALPFMLPDRPNGVVYGEMYGVDEHTLNRLDRLEAIKQGERPRFDWYSHAIVEGRDIINGERMSALAYVFTLVPPSLRHSCMRIVEGDYLNWLNAKVPYAG